MRLYEQAIRSAHATAYSHEALANELASRFYAAHGFEKIARVYLRTPLRLSALGSRWQGAATRTAFIRISATHRCCISTTTIGAPLEQLDVGTVVKASQAVSGEIVLGDLIKVLLRIAVEHAGAERGLLILSRAASHRSRRKQPPASARLRSRYANGRVTGRASESVLHTVIRRGRA